MNKSLNIKRIFKHDDCWANTEFFLIALFVFLVYDVLFQFWEIFLAVFPLHSRKELFSSFTRLLFVEPVTGTT